MVAATSDPGPGHGLGRVGLAAEVATLAMPGVVLTYLCSRIPGVRRADAFMIVGSQRGEP